MRSTESTVSGEKSELLALNCAGFLGEDDPFLNGEKMVILRFWMIVGGWYILIENSRYKLYSNPFFILIVSPVYPHRWEKRIAGLLTRPSCVPIYSQVFSSSMLLGNALASALNTRYCPDNWQPLNCTAKEVSACHLPWFTWPVFTITCHFLPSSAVIHHHLLLSINSHHYLPSFTIIYKY